MKKWFILPIFLCALISCNQGETTNPDPVATQRGGQSVVVTTTQYLDYQPTVSSDGTKVAFTSGRQNAVQRIFLSTFTQASGFSTPDRLTKDDNLTSEFDPIISPDGSYVLFSATKTDGRVLVLQKSGTTTYTIVSSNFPASGFYRFSADSTLLLFTETNATTGGFDIKTALVTAPTSATKLNTGTDKILNAFWLAPTSGYRIGVAVAGTSGQNISLGYFDFASSAASASATKTSWIASTNYDRSFSSSSGASVILTNRIIPPGSNGKTVKITGTGESVTAFARRGEATIYSTSSATGQDLAAFSFMDIPFRQLANSGALLLAVVNTPIQCKSQTLHVNPEFATFMYLTNLSNAATDTRKLIPLTGTAANTWEVSGDLCNQSRADQSLGEHDLQIVSARINEAASYNQAMVVYATSKNDEYEVRAIQILNGTPKIYEVSNNRKP